jgi:ribonucleoside-diphosphate reductase alpha chain
MEWTEAKNLDVDNDWLALPIPKTSIENPILTEEICYIYGLILSGMKNYYSETFEKEYMYPIHISHYPETMSVLSNLLKRRNVQFEVVERELRDLLILKQTTILPFCMSDFYNRSNHNNNHYLGIGQRWLMLPDNKIRRIIDGIGDNYTNSDLNFLKLRLGMIKNSHCYIRYNDYLLLSMKSMKKEKYNGILYDLEMNYQHNYLLEGALVHNGGGKRNGSFAIYLEPWHADIEMFLQMRKNHGDEELKARDLFYALWIPDLFMDRVKMDGEWSLFCPDECPRLADVWGDKFVELYTTYEKSGKSRKTMKARDLWFQIMDAQMETGTPYLLYKDTCNKKSNQQNLGTIKSSNLCSEIIEYSDDKETAVCNLASIALPTFVDTTNPSEPLFDYEKLHEVVKIITYNLNRIIDVNFYPTEKTRLSNMRHRPIGIGVQGLADLFMIMNVSFKSNEAKLINKRVFETIYHAALEKSCEMAIEEGKYETFDGSPASKGKLQFDLWGVNPSKEETRYDWDALKELIKTHGLRNSLLLAPMPTASTSQILGFNECIEPITSNIYNRRTIAGEFILANKYLMNDLIALNLWNERIKNSIIANNGSIQHIDIIPEEIREKYRTVWEIPMKHLIDMAAERGVFICQSQSLNLWIEDPNYSTLTSMHFYSWSKGLKTGIYYLRRRGKHQAQKFTIEPEKKEIAEGQLYEETEEEICEMCSA